jgi:hypothetical protein
MTRGNQRDLAREKNAKKQQVLVPEVAVVTEPSCYRHQHTLRHVAVEYFTIYPLAAGSQQRPTC